jgi:alpha-1,3-glucosyltransferase
MRLSVILADCLLLFPALLLFGRNRGFSWTSSFWMLSSPSLLLIDHGHFQYNTVVLGLCVLAVVLLLDYRRPLIATAMVTAGIWFKQMGAYYVPAFAFFLLQQCIRLRFKAGVRLLFGLAMAGICTTLVIFGPFLRLFPVLLHPVITRIFPFHRGLYEDKVANFWCALAILTKFNVGLSQDQLVRLCAGVLLLALSPSLLNLLTAKPSGDRFIYALSYCSMAFFMFSYHVHEKNILLPQIAILLLTKLSPVFVFWFSTVALLSLYQLVEKDRMKIPFMILATFWLFLSKRALRETRIGFTWKLLIVPSIVGLYLLPALQTFVNNPQRYPHLFHVLNILACAGSFCICLVYLLYQQLICDRHYYSAIPPIQSPKPHTQ